MNNKGNGKKEPWRIVAFIAALGFILYNFISKDITSIYKAMPSEQIIPLVATTVVVSLLKVVAIAGTILLIKWIITKIKNK